MEETWELKVMRRRGAEVTGVRRVEMSSEVLPVEEWPGDFMGCPPQPICWQIWCCLAGCFRVRRIEREEYRLIQGH